MKSSFETAKNVIDQNEDVYEEYEEYVPRYQEYKRKEIPIKNGEKRKYLFLCVIAVLLIGGIAIGLTLHFTRVSTTTISTTALVTTTQAPTVEGDSTTSISTTSLVTTTQTPTINEVVLMLSTSQASNVPMIIGFNGESVVIIF